MFKMLPLLTVFFAAPVHAQCTTNFNEQSADILQVFSPATECRFSSQTFKNKLAKEKFSTQEVLWIATNIEGESFNDFVKRTGNMLVKYSASTGFEACGVFAGNLTEYGVIVTTNRSSLACVTNHDLVPNQMITLKRNIHSHGAPLRYTTTAKPPY